MNRTTNTNQAYCEILHFAGVLDNFHDDDDDRDTKVKKKSTLEMENIPFLSLILRYRKYDKMLITVNKQ